MSNELRMALIAVVTAVVSAAATIGGAYLGGFFDVAKTDAASRGTINLERLKFSNELIKGALGSNNAANSLMFYADIGLLDGLTIIKVKQYASAENNRLKQGGGGASILPSFDKSALPKGLWLDHAFMKAFAPKAKLELVDALVSTGNYLLLGFGINSNAKRLSAFLAEIAYETDGFTRFEDGGDYSAAALKANFPDRFDDALAKAYAHQPEKALNRAYANRYGNGPEETGDGYKFRPRGYLWFSGRADYARYARETGVDLIANPQVMGEPQVALLVACLYWTSAGLNGLADADRFTDLARKLNNSTLDLDVQLRYADLAMKLLSEKAAAPE